jgi:hypothetical protein
LGVKGIGFPAQAGHPQGTVGKDGNHTGCKLRCAPHRGAIV